MYWEVMGSQGLGFQKSLQIFTLSTPLMVIKFNFLCFEVYLQNYCLKSYKTLLNYPSGLFKPRDVAFFSLPAYQGQFCECVLIRMY